MDFSQSKTPIDKAAYDLDQTDRAMDIAPGDTPAPDRPAPISTELLEELPYLEFAKCPYSPFVRGASVFEGLFCMVLFALTWAEGYPVDGSIKTISDQIQAALSERYPDDIRQIAQKEHLGGYYHDYEPNTFVTCRLFLLCRTIVHTPRDTGPRIGSWKFLTRALHRLTASWFSTMPIERDTIGLQHVYLHYRNMFVRYPDVKREGRENLHVLVAPFDAYFEDGERLLSDPDAHKGLISLPEIQPYYAARMLEAFGPPDPPNLLPPEPPLFDPFVHQGADESPSYE